MQLSLPAFAEQLRAACAQENAQFYIVYHINPDGDCIGTAYALALVLRALGARAAVRGRDAVPEQFCELTDSVPEDALDGSAQYICVDCKDRGRTGKEYENLPYRFWIDHHGTPEEQADYEYVRPERSACSELVLELAETLGVPVTPQMASLLFTALVTDTSRFCTVSTNTQSFESAAKLTAYGADAYALGRRYIMMKTPERLAAERIILDGMHLLSSGRVVTGMLTLADLQRAGIAAPNASPLQSINSLLESVSTAWVTVMVREYPAENPEGRTRFSVKSTRSDLSAFEIARQLGGGGHPQASGGFSSDAPEAVRQRLEQLCEAAVQALPQP